MDDERGRGQGMNIWTDEKRTLDTSFSATPRLSQSLCRALVSSLSSRLVSSRLVSSRLVSSRL
eukprot:5760322-Pyramimonas_sp.AAC.1